MKKIIKIQCMMRGFLAKRNIAKKQNRTQHAGKHLALFFVRHLINLRGNCIILQDKLSATTRTNFIQF